MTDPNANINYSFADIARYLDGSMPAKEMHDLELVALQDPFLADAIDGYREADRNKAGTHLNQIAAALQKEEPAKVIAMPKKKRYGWLVAASLLALIGTGLLFYKSENRMSKSLAENKEGSKIHTDSFASTIQPASPLSDSLTTPANTLPLTNEPRKEADGRMAMLQKKKALPSKDTKAETALQPSRAQQEAMTYTAPQMQSNDASAKPEEPAKTFRDSITPGVALSEAVVSNRISRSKVSNANGWTTDKGKPFLLSEVEVVNIGRKAKKKADTSAIKPEGGWQSFQDYLFSRLSRNDSLLLVNDNVVQPNLELEFSLDEKGSPYNVKVLHSQDSTLSNKIVTAIQNGPKWTGNDSKEKRLRLRY